MRASLSSLSGQRFDVAVIGGGINGASAAQHLAAAGYRVVLAEMSDYASSASSRSSRILHSGLRYFAPKRSVWEHLFHPRRFAELARTAFQSSAAMQELVQTIPERLEPLSLTMPVYKSMPYKGWHVDIGVWLLKVARLFRMPIAYQRLRLNGFTDSVPGKYLREIESISDLTRFTDFTFVWPERIVIDAAMDARRCGAVVRNYTTVKQLARTADNQWQLSLADSLNGMETATVLASVVINTAGVRIDEVNRAANKKNDPLRRVIGIKGTHILVRLPPAFLNEGIAAMNTENEAIFCLPVGQYHYIGPTETVYEHGSRRARPEEKEIAFLLEEINHLLPSLRLRRADVIAAWAGVRPMTFDKRFPKGMRLPFSVLHDLDRDGLPNMLALTWGTLNLHRLSARKIVKAVQKRIRPSGQTVAPRYSSLVPSDLMETALKTGEITDSVKTCLKKIVASEDVTSLIDIAYRRTALGWSPDLTSGLVRQVAEIIASELQWTKDRLENEIDDLIEYAEDQHLFKISSASRSFPAHESESAHS